MLLMAVLSRQISMRIQLVTYYVTRSEGLATVAIFLIFLPGIFLHEASHWLMARLLGLRTSRFRVWPQRQGDQIGLGSVNVQKGGVWLDVIVGMAPLITGTLLIAWIGVEVFRATSVTAALAQGKWLDGVAIFFEALGTADGLVWAYLLFAISNSMMPSSSDRQPLKPVLLYIAVAAGIYVLVGLPFDPLATLLDWIIPAFEVIVSGLLFTVVLDVFALAVLLLFELLFSRRIA